MKNIRGALFSIYLLFPLLSLCAGCATEKVWVSSSKAGAEAKKDLGECKSQADRSIDVKADKTGFPRNEDPHYENLMNGCMKSKGYDQLHRQEMEERKAVLSQTKTDLREAIKNRDYAKALKITNEYLEAHPGDADAYATRGNIYYLQGRCDLAISDIDKARSMGSKSTTISGIQALCLAENGKFKIALASVNQSLKSKPDATLYNVRAYRDSCRKVGQE